MKILIINGPNLNLLGQREKSIYGERTFESYFDELQKKFPQVELGYYQSNIEGELVDRLHAAQDEYDGVVMNAGAYTHTSIAIADAIGGIRIPVVEIHISCILARESYRHISLIAPKCKGSIMGFGLDSYRLGILSFIE
ncbi:MAG TPA: type II 3-dehydroquinate dehydratase [Candidatus Alistipes pullicola]|nr:type II 3-dehydroquinate dehydratase [Candidatus Alistipes pullicola]